MSAITDYLEIAWLNTIRGISFTPPANVYVALFNTAPTDTTPGTEPADAAYARQQVAFNAPAQEGTKGVIKNSSEIVYSTATESWGTIGWMGLFDAATGGNMLWQGAVNTAKTVDIDDQVRFQVDQLVVTLE